MSDDTVPPRTVAVHALVYLHELAGYFSDTAHGQNSLQLRFQALAQEGFDALGLAGFDAALSEIQSITADPGK